MFKKIILGLEITSMAFFSACAGLSHHKDEAALKPVRKVAVVGFSVDEPTSATIGLNIGSGKVEGAAGGSIIEKQDAHIDEMYHELSRAFQKNMKWQVMPVAQMKQHPGYKAAYDRTMKGWQNKMPSGKGVQRFNVTDIMDSESLRILGAEGRTELMKALGVDAIISAKVYVMLNGTSIMGVGARYPQSRLTFQLFTPDKDSADWFEGAVDGEQSETSVGSTAFIDESLLGKLALKSARTAYSKIGADPK